MTDGDLAYIQSGTESYTLHNGRELFSFGSGTWFGGSQAVEQMESDADFLSAKLGLETLVIVEKKRILSHLSELPILERAVPLREALSVLEDAGEAGCFFIKNNSTLVHGSGSSRHQPPHCGLGVRPNEK